MLRILFREDKFIISRIGWTFHDVLGNQRAVNVVRNAWIEFKVISKQLQHLVETALKLESSDNVGCNCCRFECPLVINLNNL